jgi:hypothetical protein
VQTVTSIRPISLCCHTGVMSLWGSDLLRFSGVLTCLQCPALKLPRPIPIQCCIILFTASRLYSLCVHGVWLFSISSFPIPFHPVIRLLTCPPLGPVQPIYFITSSSVQTIQDRLIRGSGSGRCDAPSIPIGKSLAVHMSELDCPSVPWPLRCDSRLVGGEMHL